MTDAQREALSTDDPEHKLRVIGSIIQLCGWNSYSVILWAFKASWLVFYIRLTVLDPDDLALAPLLHLHLPRTSVDTDRNGIV
jgi:hypothetical protein